MDKIPLETCGEEAAIRFRDCFSVRYIQSAAVLCRLGYGIEKACTGSGFPSQEMLLQHEAFILSSVLSTVSFLESAVNDLYADAADDAYFFADEENEALLRRIGEKWHNEKNFDRAPLIGKYQKILAIAGRPLFEEGDQVLHAGRRGGAGGDDSGAGHKMSEAVTLGRTA